MLGIGRNLLIAVSLAATLVLPVAVSAATDDDIAFIKGEYWAVSERIARGNPFVTRYEAKLCPIPIMGSPDSRAAFHFDTFPARSEREEGRYILRKSEYWYQFGDVQYEEFLYDAVGAVLFYHYKRGAGSIAKIGVVKWNREERYYFKASKLLRVIVDGKTEDNPGNKLIKKGKSILDQGKRMRELGFSIRIFPLGDES